MSLHRGLVRRPPEAVSPGRNRRRPGRSMSKCQVSKTDDYRGMKRGDSQISNFHRAPEKIILGATGTHIPLLAKQGTRWSLRFLMTWTL